MLPISGHKPQTRGTLASDLRTIPLSLTCESFDSGDSFSSQLKIATFVCELESEFLKWCVLVNSSGSPELGEMAQSVSCLSSKHTDLSLSPTIHVRCVYNPTSPASLARQPSLLMSFRSV